jgi:hypothetical protein
MIIILYQPFFNIYFHLFPLIRNFPGNFASVCHRRGFSWISIGANDHGMVGDLKPIYSLVI